MKRNLTMLALSLFISATLFGGAADDPALSEVLEKHIAAIGGREAWKKVRTVEEKTETEILGAKRITTRIEDHQTGRYKSVTVSGDGVTEIGFDGTRAWQKAPFFRGYLDDSDPRARLAIRRPPQLIDYRENGQTYRRLPNETVDGKENLVVESDDVDHLGRAVKVKHYFDPATYRLTRVTRGSAVASTTVFDDYRTVDGVLIAFKRTTVNPQVNVVTVVKEWKSNVPVTDATFAFSEASGGAKTDVPATTTELRTFSPKEEIGEQLRLDTFELVWRTINETYWDPRFGGVDWKAVHDEYVPKVKSAKTSEQLHNVLNDMIGRLGRSHFTIVRPDRVLGLHTRDDRNLDNGSLGLTLRLMEGQVVVYDLDPDYPASAAGVQTGWVVERVNDRTPLQIYEKVLREQQGFQLRPEISRIRALREEIVGKPGENVTIDFLDQKDRPHRLTLTRKAEPIGKTELEFESKRLADGIGYIRFSIFFGDLLAKFEAALRSLRDVDTLIIDLRGNPGGAGDLAPAIASRLSPSAGSLGRSKFRYSTRDFAFQPAAEPYRGRVYVLVDEWSASTSEVFTSGLQESKRVTVVGVSTAGAVLPSLMAPLPTGGALQYVISDFRTPSGRLVEGAGVKPDVEARVTRASLIAGTDPVIERALTLARGTASGG